MPNLPLHKGVYILPNLFTTGSMFAAFLGLLAVHAGNFVTCAIAILVSALLDGLDGKVARLTGSSSDFGIQLDSLADCVAFGVTPAYMVYMWNLNSFGRWGVAVSFLFMACCAMRLARFNVTTATSSKKFFIGLPTPAAGCALACLVLFSQRMPEFVLRAMPSFTLIFTAALAILMVSRVRYLSFKEYGFVKAHPFRYMVLTVALLLLIFSEPRIFGFLVFFGYLCGGLIYTYYILPRRVHLHEKPKNAGQDAAETPEEPGTGDAPADVSNGMPNEMSSGMPGEMPAGMPGPGAPAPTDSAAARPASSNNNQKI